MQIPKSIITLAFLVVLFSLYSCHPLFCVWNSGYTEIDHHIKVNNLTGVYTLTDYSKKMMYYEGKYKNIPSSKIQLNEDSTYIITNAPDWLINPFGDPSQHYFTKSGKWTLNRDNLEEYTINLQDLPLFPRLRSKKNKISILLTIGDPDECLGMVYEKQ